MMVSGETGQLEMVELPPSPPSQWSGALLALYKVEVGPWENA